MQDITIVTVVNNNKVFDNCLLNSLNKQRQVKIELIKIDNTKNQYDSLAKAYLDNFDQIHSEWTMFVHPDIIFLSRYEIRNLIDMAKKSLEHDSNIAVWGVAGKNINNEIVSNIFDNVSCYKHKYNSFDKSKNFIYVKVLDACCWLVKTDFIKEIGFMPSSEGFHMVVEEVCVHALSIGKRVVVLSSKIWHYSPSNAYNYTYWREGIKVVKKYKLDSFITTSTLYNTPFLLPKMYCSLVRCYIFHDLIIGKIGCKLQQKFSYRIIGNREKNMNYIIEIIEELFVYIATFRIVVKDTIEKKRNDNYLASLRKEILNNEERLVKENSVFEDAISYIKRNDSLTVFNAPFEKKYKKLVVKPMFDSTLKLKYVIHNGNRLYFPRMIRKTLLKEMYTSLRIEQDNKSPHKYLYPGENLDGYVVFDCGCAEANFTLDVIEQAKMAYLFEGDSKWIMPLKATFSQWKNKVQIINKFIGEMGDETISLRKYIEMLVKKGRLDPESDKVFIKMDIEGNEVKVLRDILPILNSFKNIKLAVCVYHRADHEKVIKDLLPCDFVCRVRNGYMVFVYEHELPGGIEPAFPYFRHGVMRIERETI